MAKCPCQLIEPCKATCTCNNPFMSGGCERCCTYGNREQQIKKAKFLAETLQWKKQTQNLKK